MIGLTKLNWLTVLSESETITDMNGYFIRNNEMCEIRGQIEQIICMKLNVYIPFLPMISTISSPQSVITAFSDFMLIGLVLSNE